MNQARKIAVASVLVPVGAFVGGAGAFAVPPTVPADVLGGGMDSGSSTAITYLTTSIAPAIVILTVVGALFGLALRWLRRGVRSVGG